MQVRQGWSGEISPNRWGKLDVIVDEGDLRRILLAAGIDVDPDRVPTAISYQLMDVEGERFLLAKLVTRYGDPEEAGRIRLKELAEARARALDKLRGILGTAPDG